MRQFIQENTGLCSFSEVPDSIIMWGHYAHDHRGFCIEYDLKALTLDHNLRRMLCPVIYSNDLFDATKYFGAAGTDLTRFNNTFATVAALYKSLEWQYEREWRLILPGGVLKRDKYSMPTPTRVFLGSRVSAADKDRLVNICQERNIGCYQMRLAANSFKLESDRI